MVGWERISQSPFFSLITIAATVETLFVKIDCHKIRIRGFLNDYVLCFGLETAPWNAEFRLRVPLYLHDFVPDAAVQTETQSKD